MLMTNLIQAALWFPQSLCKTSFITSGFILQIICFSGLLREFICSCSVFSSKNANFSVFFASQMWGISFLSQMTESWIYSEMSNMKTTWTGSFQVLGSEKLWVTFLHFSVVHKQSDWLIEEIIGNKNTVDRVDSADYISGLLFFFFSCFLFLLFLFLFSVSLHLLYVSSQLTSFILFPPCSLPQLLFLFYIFVPPFLLCLFSLSVFKVTIC